MKKPLLIILTLLSILVRDVQAQIQVEIRKELKNYIPIISALNKEKTSIISFNPPDIKKLLKEDENDSGPYRFGKALKANIGLPDGYWTNIESGRVWTVSIKSPGALSINLIFDQLILGSNSKLYLTSMDEKMVIGPVTAESISPSGIFPTDLINSNQILIALFEPVEDFQFNRLHISEVVYGYKSLSNYIGYGDSAPCHNDIICSEGNGWQEEADAVALVIINGTRACSGALLNNGCQDLTPNFLTAFHCLDANGNGILEPGERTAVSTWAYRFQYESPSCGGIDDTNYSFFSGSLFRAGWQQSDFALVQLNNRPGPSTGIRYSGWSRAAVAPASSVGIHHPRGDVMKISVENNTALSVAWPGTPANTHWRVSFDDGVVEHGSSGSPLFDQNGRIVGQLHGNQNNSCNPIDKNSCFCNQPIGEYGRFDVSWNGGGTADTRLSSWLTNDPNITQVNTIMIPSLAGPNLVCTTGSFVLNNAPATNISWSVLPSNLVTPSSGTGATANVSKVSNGNATITFSVGCGNPGIYSMPFHTGPYSSSDYPISGPSSAPCNSFAYYSVPTLPGATSVNWVWPNGWTYISGQGTANLALKTSNNSGPVLAGVNNQCGQSGSYDDQFTSVFGSCSFSNLAIYPNPASDLLNIDFTVDTLSTAIQTHEIRIHNIFNELVFSQKTSSSSEKIPIKHFPIGQYIVTIVGKDGVIQRKIWKG